MCEMLLVTAAEPFRLDAVWDLVERMERYGVAGFSWGAAWVTSAGRLDAHRSTCPFRDDPVATSVGARESTALLVHLRRPSKLSTIGPADTQPFVDPDGRFAFAHNGNFERYLPLRRELVERGRIRGRADSEVGQRVLEDVWAVASPRDALEGLHEALGGRANLMTLGPDGRAAAYAGNEENPLFRFRLGSLRVVSTALYSIDRSLFQLAAPGARDRSVVRVGTTITVGGA